MRTRKEAADNEEIWAKTKTRTNSRRINIPPLNTTTTMKTIIANHLRMMKRKIKKKKKTRR